MPEGICDDPSCTSETVIHRAHSDDEESILCECSHFKTEHEWNIDWPGGADKFPGLTVPDELVGSCKICKCEKYKYKVGYDYSDVPQARGLA
jgi:hypothetical protein